MIAVTGLGLWSPGYADLAAWTADARDEAVTLPKCAIADARSKRGTSRIARMLGEVTQQAGEAGRVDLATTPTVYASAWGEIDIMVGLLGQIADGEAGLSPLRFKHSVHNAAGGLVSIATGNTGFSTSIAAGFRSFEMGLVEVFGLIESGAADRALFALAEDRLPEPLARYGDYEALAVGICFEAGPGRDALGHVVLDDASADAARPDAPERFRASPVAYALPLVEALVEGRALAYRTAPGDEALTLRVVPAGGGVA